MILCERGKELTSEGLADLLRKAGEDNTPLTFCIGGPFGHSDAVSGQADVSKGSSTRSEACTSKVLLKDFRVHTMTLALYTPAQCAVICELLWGVEWNFSWKNSQTRNALAVEFLGTWVRTYRCDAAINYADCVHVSHAVSA